MGSVALAITEQKITTTIFINMSDMHVKSTDPMQSRWPSTNWEMLKRTASRIMQNSQNTSFYRYPPFSWLTLQPWQRARVLGQNAGICTNALRLCVNIRYCKNLSLIKLTIIKWHTPTICFCSLQVWNEWKLFLNCTPWIFLRV